jgi:protocatechuate 3,4-dioxygenase beta subunit
MSDESCTGGVRKPPETARMDFTEITSAAIVSRSLQHTGDPRLRLILERLVHHLHAFCSEVDLTQEEWAEGIGFLTATGRISDDVRQEFILLSDVLGVSMLVDAIAHRFPENVTASTVLGPFHMVDSPPRALGSTISLAAGGEPCLITGTVSSADGTPLPGALVDVWQADDHGRYDVQVPTEVPAGNLRGLFTCNDDGGYSFRTVMPAAYPIPSDGPVGQLLRACDRLPYRPAHIHFIAGAAGHRSVTTHLFVAGSRYLDSDAVFGVKDSLIREFATIEDPDQIARYGMPGPFRHCDFQIRLEPSQLQP